MTKKPSETCYLNPYFTSKSETARRNLEGEKNRPIPNGNVQS